MVEILCYRAKRLPDMLLATHVQARPHHQCGILGIKVHQGIEVSAAYCLISGFNNLFEFVWLHNALLCVVGKIQKADTKNPPHGAGCFFITTCANPPLLE